MSVVLPVDPVAGESGRQGAIPAMPEQIRVAVHVGRYLVETSLSAYAPLSVVMVGLVPFLAEQLRNEGLEVSFSRTAIYSLAVEGGFAFPRSTTLADAGVRDGDRLILKEVHSSEVFTAVIEDRADAIAEFNAAKFPTFVSDKFNTARALALTTLVAGSVLVSLLLLLAWRAASTLQWWLPPAGALTALAVIGSVLAQRRHSASAISYALGIAAVPLAFAAGWVAVPAYDGIDGHWTAANFFAGVFAAGGASLLVAWLTGVGITVHTATVTASVVGAAAAAAATFTGFQAHQIATVAVLVGLIVQTAAPALALALARVRPPSLPVPGEGIDKNELEEAAMAVEVFEDSDNARTVALSDEEDTQLERRSRSSNKYLTGLFIAAVLVIATGAIAAVQPPGSRYFYGEIAVAVLAMLVLLLKGRSLPDRVQATSFYVGAFLLATGLTVRVVTSTDNTVAQLSVIGGVVAAVVAAVLAGLRLPGRRLSPVMLRRIENLEFMFIMAIPVVAFWVIGVYAAFRNLR
jgi:type VII secretion integral membrane protein EccD